MKEWLANRRLQTTNLKKVAVLISGSGTILKSMLDYGITVGVVIADRECKGLEFARELGIPVVIIDRKKDFGWRRDNPKWNRKGFTRAIVNVLDDHEIEVVAMAGFMTILHPVIFERYKKRVINIHPALLPAYPGDTAVKEAWEDRVWVTGTTVHLATQKLDDATYILGKSRVWARWIRSQDPVGSLHERIKRRERRLYPRILWKVQRGKINLGEVKGKVRP